MSLGGPLIKVEGWVQTVACACWRLTQPVSGLLSYSLEPICG